MVVIGMTFRCMLCALLASALVLSMALPSWASEPLGVHLASYRSEERAEQGWNILVSEHGELLGGLEHRVVRADLGPDKGIYYRLLAGPFADEDQARSLHEKLASKGAESSLRRAPLESKPEAELASRTPELQTASGASPQTQPEARVEQLAQERLEQAIETADSSRDADADQARAIVVKAGPEDGIREIEEPSMGEYNPYVEDTSIPGPRKGPVLAKTQLNERVHTEFGASPGINGSTPEVDTFSRLNMDMGDVILSPQLNMSTGGEVAPFAGFTIPF